VIFYILNIYKLGKLKEPSNIEYSYIFWGKYFGKVKNGQKKCPKTEKGKTVLPKCES